MKNGHLTIKNTLLSAPEAPGIYQMFSENEEILYIGKAKNLKNRLKNYISNNLTTCIIQLVSQIFEEHLGFFCFFRIWPFLNCLWPNLAI